MSITSMCHNNYIYTGNEENRKPLTGISQESDTSYKIYYA